jgi:hypothetical protein
MTGTGSAFGDLIHGGAEDGSLNHWMTCVERRGRDFRDERTSAVTVKLKRAVILSDRAGLT